LKIKFRINKLSTKKQHRREIKNGKQLMMNLEELEPLEKMTFKEK
jgi:hypothetical protein